MISMGNPRRGRSRREGYPDMGRSGKIAVTRSWDVLWKGISGGSHKDNVARSNEGTMLKVNQRDHRAIATIARSRSSSGALGDFVVVISSGSSRRGVKPAREVSRHREAPKNRSHEILGRSRSGDSSRIRRNLVWRHSMGNGLDKKLRAVQRQNNDLTATTSSPCLYGIISILGWEQRQTATTKTTLNQVSCGPKNWEPLTLWFEPKAQNGISE